MIELAAGTSPSVESTAQRCRSVAHYLTLLDANPTIVASEGAYRDALWSPPAALSAEHAVVAGQWSALAAKDVWQEAVCSIWSEFCRVGLARTRALARGLTWQETRELVDDLLDGPPSLAPGTRTADLAAAISAGDMRVPSGDDTLVAPQRSLDELRRLTRRLDTATSGLVVFLELVRRMEDRAGAGWESACRVRSAWQPSIGAVKAELDMHLRANPGVTDTVWWVLSRFVVPVHERIAYSKLPAREFTFRFRWEDGLLRFYDLGVGRFPLAAIRNEPLSLLTHDLGFWDNHAGAAALTERGQEFITEMLG